MRTLMIESLPKNEEWIDKDLVMLHACFQLLKDFVDEEGGLKNLNYEANKEFVDEVKELYDWWEKRKTTPMQVIFEEDDKMLLRLLKIRKQLWC